MLHANSPDLGEEKFGNFSYVSENYKYRPYYSFNVFEYLSARVLSGALPAVAADIGAGSGKLVEMLARLGFHGFAIEPNREMVSHGRQQCLHIPEFAWLEATAESTELADQSVSWVCMGSMFHWTDQRQALEECHRILSPGGFLSVIYDLTDIGNDPIQMEVENLIKRSAPGVKRARGPIEAIMSELETILGSASGFDGCVYVESQHVESMDVDRYMRVWDTAHDLRGQLSRQQWAELKASIFQLVKHIDVIPSKYRTSAWTVRRI
ncbi:class I SAM-dependent methyltransferase [Rhizobium leguminosarum]|uniref:class I SAM-dependent methyltransferase n=1 Tax=Rhizobium leguminosarum TaxID=384 RepID=UPI001C942BD9|nr:class I SAM-dependent methyltransferase [Rhizobium leguminosarum]MBY5720931.1 class I SAM-dependent methyltransferase [Rhizobium leguminosarum]